MKKRYLPFGYQITDGKTTIVQEEAEAVQYIFEEYTAGKSLRKIAENMTARKTPYHEDSSKWNQNMVSRVLANEIYCGNEKYLPIIKCLLVQTEKICYDIDTWELLPKQNV